tara:strand:+ start:3551 stop:5074 length:1524 start_codon:yes stop_codon:yes gene_type:complete
MSNLGKVIKIQSNQGSGFDGTKRLCDFDIPPAVYDLSESYVNLVASVTTADAGTIGGQGVYELKTAFDGATFGAANENVYPAVALIKNAHLSSAKDGQIANVRKIDTLHSTLHQYTKSYEENYSEQYSTFSNMVSKKFTRNSPFRELTKQGTDASRNVDQSIKIPLKDIFPYCDFPEYDGNRHGQTRLGLELQTDLFQVQTSTDNNHMSYQGRNTFTYTTPNALETDKTTLTTDYVFRSLEESPFYVSQKLDFTAVPNGGGNNVAFSRMITGIEYLTGTDQQKLRLTFNAVIFDGNEAPHPAVTNKTYVITALPHDIDGAATVTPNFSSANLVLSVVGQPEGLDSKPREYKSYNSEEYNANGANPTHQQQVNVEPNCRAVYIMYPNTVISQNNALDNASSYRLRHNDRDLTNRNINFFTPLHKERIMMGMGESDYDVKNLQGLVPAAKEDEKQRESLGGTTNTIDVKMICAPVSSIPEYSLLQINHDGIGGGGLNRVIVYKECVKVV